MDIKLRVIYVLLLSVFCVLLTTNAKKARTTVRATPSSTSKTTHASTKKSTKPENSTKAPTNSTKLRCEDRNASCSFCTQHNACFFCGEDKTCRKYDKSKVIPRSCGGNKWYWKQCTIPGNVLIIAIPTIAGVLLIMIGVCVYCCCCRTRKANTALGREEARQGRNRQDREQRNEERRKNRGARQLAIKMKYGLLKNQNEDDLQPIV